MALSPATITAHSRYQEWYYAIFRGIKPPFLDDEAYEDGDDSDGTSIQTSTYVQNAH